MEQASHRTNRLQTQPTAEFSSTSALDIGPANSGPSSPVLGNLTSREGSISRRRLSWGRLERQRVDGAGDPLRINTSMGGYDANTKRNVQGSVQGGGATTDDPFAPESDTPQEEDALAPRRIPSVPYYPLRHEEAGTSQQSLVRSFLHKSTASSEYEGIDLDDDMVGLTETSYGGGNRPTGTRGTSTGDSFRIDTGVMSTMDHDVERTPDRTTKRRSARYSLTPTPASRLRSVKKSLRRASMRVVNLAGVNLEDRVQAVRLPDDKEELKSKGKAKVTEMEIDDSGTEEEELPDLAKRLPIRGRTLGVFGPTSRIRLAMFRFLTHPCVIKALYSNVFTDIFVLGGLNHSYLYSSSSTPLYLQYKPQEQSMLTMRLYMSVVISTDGKTMCFFRCSYCSRMSLW